MSSSDVENVWAQWLNVYNTAPRGLRSLLATFADVYPNVAVFRIGDGDLVLIGATVICDEAAVSATRNQGK